MKTVSAQKRERRLSTRHGSRNSGRDQWLVEESQSAHKVRFALQDPATSRQRKSQPDAIAIVTPADIRRRRRSWKIDAWAIVLQFVPEHAPRRAVPRQVVPNSFPLQHRFCWPVWEGRQPDFGQTPELSIRILFEVGFKHCPELSVLDGIPELEFNCAVFR